MYSYPLTLSFKIIAIAPQVKVTDASGETILYVRQKALALREDVKVFGDDQQKEQLFRIHADRWIDWSARYDITTTEGGAVGAIQRHGMRSLWNTAYTITDPSGAQVAAIREENPMVKVLDSLVGMVPIAGDVASYFINPTYLVDAPDGTTSLALRKRPAFFEGRFILDKRGDLDEVSEPLLVTSVLMMLLLERNRG